MHFAGYVLCVTCLSEYGIYVEGIYVEESISVKLNFKTLRGLIQQLAKHFDGRHNLLSLYPFNAGAL